MTSTIMELILTIVKFSLIVYFVLKMDKYYKANDTHSMIYHGLWVLFLVM